MKLFGFGKQKEEIIAILDIGSASVGGAIVRDAALSNPEILTSARVPINFLPNVDFQAFWGCARNAAKKTLRRLLKDFPKGAGRVACVFSSPWFISQTRIISVTRDEQFEVDEDFFNKLIDNEISIFKSQWQSKTERLRGEPEVLEHKVMKVALNGYRTSKPLGKRAKTLKAHIYMSLGIKRAKEDLEKDILDNFGDASVSFHTLPFAAFTSLRNIISPEWGYIFADIGGEVSDISLVREDVLEETVSFPAGKNLPTRMAAAKFKTPVEDAASLVQRFARGHASAADAAKMAPVMEEAKEEWRRYLRQALVEISDNGPLPRDFFLIGGGAGSGGIAECAEEDFFAQFTILGKPFRVKKILPEALKKHFEFKRSFERDGDVFLMLESLFALKGKKDA